ncbi:GDP-mannose 4,6-dehydratase [Sphingomonas sp. PAMC 26617]|uniref:GDP-mannose 4,6-dehydratase n=1 Tax=Sphingomonas sp. PAMC 26617 TaxID=1112216 RepID=UPI000289C16A|nr:GDP-mannose 4,6-dehydratase [Sphingomonas sp. PAMC 26617]
MSKIALITGITGQDGAFLARHLIDLGYEVHGVIRRSSAPNIHRLSRIVAPELANGTLKLHYGDMTDFSSMVRIVGDTRPHEIYNLAAQSHVAVSFETPEYTASADGIGPLRLLEAIRIAGLTHHTRFYQASTSELYGKVHEIPQRETTPFHPRSPYGVAKLYGYWITVNYREAYGMHASNGILFNHEGELRGELFVTRKITKAVGRMALGHRQPLRLGNLDAQRDWGDAQEYIRGMHLILQQETPDDYVLATGEMHSVREFVEVALNHIDKQVVWEGEGVDEVGICKATGERLVMVDKDFFRPAEVELLLGDPSKAKEKLGWSHEKDFKHLVADMVQADIRRQELISQNGIELEDFL